MEKYSGFEEEYALIILQASVYFSQSWSKLK